MRQSCVPTHRCHQPHNRHLRSSRLVQSLAFAGALSCSNGDTAADNPQVPEKKPGEAPGLVPGTATSEQFVTLQQVTRQFFQEEFVTDVFEPVMDAIDLGKLSPPLIDILIVVDNSGSMSEEQANLSTKMEFLLSSIKSMDWQINVITTDSSCPTTKDLPLKSIPGQTDITDQQKNTFKSAVVPGTNGHWNEIGVQAAWHHLKPKAWNMPGYPSCPEQPTWIRKQTNSSAMLAIIFVSDENEYMDNPSVQRAKYVKDMLDLFLEKGYTPGKDVKAFGMIWPPEVPESNNYNPCHPDQPSEVQRDLIVATKGFYVDVCDTDYSHTLSSISKEISKMSENKIALTQKPVPSTIVVTKDDIPTDKNEWYYDVPSNAIYFKGVLAAGSTYNVIYKTDETRRIPLKSQPNESTIKITVDGRKVNSDAYIYNGDDSSLLFRSPLAEGVTTKISYRDQQQLLKEFKFPNVGNKSISCSVDGEAIAHLYFPNDQIIAFNPPPEDGKKIICRY